MSQILRQKTFLSGQEIQIVQGDITQEPVDAIVNAANRQLQHGGGLAGVIVRRGGWQIQKESTEWVRKNGSVAHSEPAFTTAGKLPCKYVIHAVGPRWGEGDEEVKLAAAVTGSLKLADELKLKSLAIPAISTGIFSFPKARAAEIIFETIKKYFVDQPQSDLARVRLTLYDQPTVDVFLSVWDVQ